MADCLTFQQLLYVHPWYHLRVYIHFGSLFGLGPIGDISERIQKPIVSQFLSVPVVRVY